MENFVKAVLYAYPLLNKMDEAYRVHIRNKAVLSYRSDAPALVQAQSIASEILEKRKLAWLKATLEKVFARLTEAQRALLSIRFSVGKEKSPDEKSGCGALGKGKYFRQLKRLEEKLRAMLKGEGLTEESFEKDFSKMELFRHIGKKMRKKGEVCTYGASEVALQ